MQCIISNCIELNRFYKNNNDKARAKPSDIMYAVINEQQMIMAVMRLLPYEGFLFMRSVLTAKEYRGQGVGSQLLRFAIKQQNQQTLPLPIYALPTSMAKSLYMKQGFIPVDQSQMPAQLLTSYRRFRHSTTDSTAMVLHPRVG